MIKSKVFGRMAQFCNEGCRDAFRSDRKARLMYGAVKLADDIIVSWERASIELDRCAYCLDKHISVK